MNQILIKKHLKHLILNKINSFYLIQFKIIIRY